MMDSFTDDLWAIVLARLPLKTMTASKLVCKQWKSIVESPYLHDLFLSLHQNSHSCSWSLMHYGIETMAHYRCNTWGLERSLDSFISSFVEERFKSKRQRAEVVAYSDVGLVLIHVKPHEKKEKGSFYVANPVSQECIEIFLDTLPLGFKHPRNMGFVARTEKGVVLGYKVVLMDERQREISTTSLTFLIYSSETGTWSLNTFHLHYSGLCFPEIISLNGSLHWNAMTSGLSEEFVLVSIDFYATGTGSDRCRVTPFPDSDTTTSFGQGCSISQGFLMYMNGVTSLEDKLRVWRLQSDGWQLVSEISPAFLSTDVNCVPLVVDPFDAKTAYFWSKAQEALLSINLHNGKFVLHNHQLEDIKHEGLSVISVKDPRAMMVSVEYMNCLFHSKFSSYILPHWLHRIPNTVTRV